jgi:hypothetical protein
MSKIVFCCREGGCVGVGEGGCVGVGEKVRQVKESACVTCLVFVEL